MPRKIILLLGPTGVGKTKVACALQDRLADRCPTELISVDSTLVYRGMDIGSAKPTPAELKANPHKLIDIRDPQDTYTAADFVTDADACVQAALSEKKLPVIVGGSMLYANRFVRGIAELPRADPVVRLQLQAEFDLRGGDALHAELLAVDPAAAAKIHPRNAQRLLRALEVIRLTGRAISEQWLAHNSPGAADRLDAQIYIWAIVPDDRLRLHQRITQRFDAMLAAGFEQELQRLIQSPDIHAELPSMRAVGYRQGLQYLAGEIDAQAFREQALAATRRLAKRQLTWLRQWPEINSLNWGDADEVAGRVAEQLRL